MRNNLELIENSVELFEEAIRTAPLNKFYAEITMTANGIVAPAKKQDDTNQTHIQQSIDKKIVPFSSKTYHYNGGNGEFEGDPAKPDMFPHLSVDFNYVHSNKLINSVYQALAAGYNELYEYNFKIARPANNGFRIFNESTLDEMIEKGYRISGAKIHLNRGDNSRATLTLGMNGLEKGLLIDLNTLKGKDENQVVSWFEHLKAEYGK
ncbi:hypothetical protein HQ529_00345 [Candidatus Woesearchaeota archaeon]|nr:hypothetical protein [Candidatus Woesearchaeota archaeon]